MSASNPETNPANGRNPKWLNRNVVGMGLTSLLADAGYEMANAVLPSFLAVIGVSAAALGAIEGVADALSASVKLGMGWYSDRIGHRKPITVVGYFLTGLAKSLFAFAYGWPLILAGRLVGWFGKGLRKPLRDALLTESVPADARGKAFGFHRAGDTLGAIIGPLAGVLLLAWMQHHGAGMSSLIARMQPHATDISRPFRVIFLLTLIPGLGSGLAMALMVTETRRRPSPAKFWTAIRSLPKPYIRFLTGVGLFGMGDFAHTLMILAATQLLAPTHTLARAAEIAALLYVVHNVVYAGASYPIGALSDKIGRRGLLALGYVVGALTAAGLATAFLKNWDSWQFLALLFALGGLYIAAEDALEGATTADLITAETRGTAFGVTAAVNGIGDFVASTLTGFLWTAVSPVVAFACAGVLMLAGAVVIYRVR
jgi:MFS family permease